MPDVLQELDCLLSRHVMSLHSAPSASTSRCSSQVTSVTVRRNSSVCSVCFIIQLRILCTHLYIMLVDVS